MLDVSSHTLKLKVCFQRSSPRAYRPFRSTESAIICVHNDLVRAIDDRKATLLVLLDLSAAFDTVDHEILLSILETRFAIQCTALDWLRSYLTGRTQVFVYADKQTVSYTQCYALCRRVPCSDLSALSRTLKTSSTSWSSTKCRRIYMLLLSPMTCQAFEGNWEHVRPMWLNGVPLDVYTTKCQQDESHLDSVEG